MDLQTGTQMPKYAAQHAFLEYRRGLHAKRSVEDEEILAGYRAMGRGQRVITLREVIPAAGQHENGMPKLAVVRADQERVRCKVAGWTARFLPIHRSFYESRVAKEFDISVRVPTWRDHTHSVEGTAVVPIIPPHLRPAGDKLCLYHLLFEADWKVPPKDPALLKRLGRDLWAVVAVWDLTELERKVLLQR